MSLDHQFDAHTTIVSEPGALQNSFLDSQQTKYTILCNHLPQSAQEHSAQNLVKIHLDMGVGLSGLKEQCQATTIG